MISLLGQRIMIVGQPGSGKSTLARQLGAKLKLPVVHIDHIHWQSGWVERPAAEKDRLCFEVHARDQWIFEGGKSSTWPDRLERADTLIWLDFPLCLRVWRVCLRTIKNHGKNRPDLPNGCPDRFDGEFMTWIWSTRKSHRVLMQNFYLAAPGEKNKYRLSSRREVNDFLQGILTNPADASRED